MPEQLHKRFSDEEVRMLLAEVELRIGPDEKTDMAEVRIWYKDILTDVYQVKNTDLNLVRS